MFAMCGIATYAMHCLNVTVKVGKGTGLAFQQLSAITELNNP